MHRLNCTCTVIPRLSTKGEANQPAVCDTSWYAEAWCGIRGNAKHDVTALRIYRHLRPLIPNTSNGLRRLRRRRLLRFQRRVHLQTSQRGRRHVMALSRKIEEHGECFAWSHNLAVGNACLACYTLGDDRSLFRGIER